MTSILKVDTIQDTAGNNIINESGDTITIGASGDTITIPSGATLDVTSATVSGITSYTDTDALDLFNASGSAPVFACRAWVNFDGTGTPAINGSGNVTSITDNGTGDYTVNFTNALPDANYSAHTTGTAAAGSSQNVKILSSTTGGVPTLMSSSAIRIAGFSSADYDTVCVSVFR
jgi:hypothetical protein